MLPNFHTDEKLIRMCDRIYETELGSPFLESVDPFRVECLGQAVRAEVVGTYLIMPRGRESIALRNSLLGACRATPYSHIIVARWCLCLHYGILTRLLGV